MSLQAIADLTNDVLFIGRVRACTVQQAGIFNDDQRPQLRALAGDLMRGNDFPVFAFVRIIASFPGLAEQIPAPVDGVVDSEPISDADILAHVQSNFPVVAALYFDDDGNRLENP